jgi:hypothetical protein
MTRPEIQALYNRLLASPSEDGVTILADAFQRAQVDAAKAERERIVAKLADMEDRRVWIGASLGAVASDLGLSEIVAGKAFDP